MGIKSIVLAASTLVLSMNVSAALVTVGNLSTYDDGSSNIITDSLNNVEYLRLDVLADYTYAQTLAVLDTQDGGGWSIANAAQAIGFTAAALGGVSACTHNGNSVTGNGCGYISNWTDGLLGDNYNVNYDFAWFLDEQGQADYVWIEKSPFGLMSIADTTLSYSDNFSAAGAYVGLPISWLMVRDVSPVPVPAAMWLFGSGLLGLIGVARRKVCA